MKDPTRVYLVTDGHGVKVGINGVGSPSRINALQTGNPRKLTEIFSETISTRTGARCVEDAFKTSMRHNPAPGGTEWFAVTPETAIKTAERLCGMINNDGQRIPTSSGGTCTVEEATACEISMFLLPLWTLGTAYGERIKLTEQCEVCWSPSVCP